MSKIQGASFEKNATTGVGGPCNFFFHEEWRLKRAVIL